jgi:hypothetical protein
MKTKKCFKCNKNKSLTDYYVHKQMADGRVGKCKECAKKDVLEHRQDNIEKVRAYDRERGKLPHRIKQRTQDAKAWRKKFPKRYKAHKVLNAALKSGKVVKPYKCCKCKVLPLQMEGHHDDYDKPLEVVWLCSCCHRQLHRDLKMI